MREPRRVRLKHLVDINNRALPETTNGETELRYIDVSSCGRGSLVADPERMHFRDAPTRARRLVQPGDTMISTVRTYLRAVWPVSGTTEDLVVSTAFAVLSPRANLDARFLGWLAQSDVVIEEIVARSVGVSYPALNGLEVGDIRVPVPEPREQRVIADYLDTEAEQIDSIVGRRRRQRQLLDEREFGILSLALVPSDVPMARLGFKATVQTGLTVDAQRDLGSDSVSRPYLRVANVQHGWLELDSVTDITVPRSLAERCTLRVGDVLMTEGGDLDKLGRGTMWRGELAGALHQNHVFAVRPDPAHLDAEYLALLTRTAHARAYFEKTGTRTTNLASTNAEKILALPIPDIDFSVQKHLVRQVSERLAGIPELQTGIDRQVECLLERRQALITAAVTGQLELSGVAA